MSAQAALNVAPVPSQKPNPPPDGGDWYADPYQEKADSESATARAKAGLEGTISHNRLYGGSSDDIAKSQSRVTAQERRSGRVGGYLRDKNMAPEAPPSGAQAALNMKPYRFLDYVAKKGSKGDDHIAHVGTLDTVIPQEQIRKNPKVREHLAAAFREMKRDPGQFIVGHPRNRRNPKTGLREFADSGGGDVGGVGDAPGPTGDPRGDTPVGNPAGPNASSTAVSAQNQTADIENRGLFETSPSADPQGYGNRSLFGGTAGSFGQPSTGIGFVDNKLNDAINNPAETALNIGLGFTPLGMANTAIGAADLFGAGIPSLGGMLTGAGRALSNQNFGGGFSTGNVSSAATSGSGGSTGAIEPAGQDQQDTEWLKRLGLAG